MLGCSWIEGDKEDSSSDSGKSGKSDQNKKMLPRRTRATFDPSKEKTPNVAEFKAANEDFQADFSAGHLSAPPARKMAVVTCMDARLHPEAFMGFNFGDCHMIRNAGGRVSDDALRSLVISQRFLGTEEVVVIHHTECGKGPSWALVFFLFLLFCFGNTGDVHCQCGAETRLVPSVCTWCESDNVATCVCATKNIKSLSSQSQTVLSW